MNHRPRRAAALASLILILAPHARAGADAPAATLLSGANVIDMRSERVRTDHAVLVRNGRIAWVGPSSEAPGAAGAAGAAVPNVIDVGGAYLLPGLIDSHVHLGDPREYPLYLAAGVTTAVELGGPDHRAWRERLARRQVPGPRLLTCGPTVSAASADEARDVVIVHRDAGYDCIKIYDEMPAEVFAALAAAARELGLRSAAHIPRNLTWDDMLTAAPDAVAHAEEFLYSPCCGEQELERIARTMRERGIALMTTLVTYDNITAQVSDLELFLARQPSRFYPPVEFRAWRPPLNRYAEFADGAPIEMRRLFGFQRWLVDFLHERGVRIIAGTDAGNTGTLPGVSMADELAWLVAAGLTPYEALAGATVEAAEWIGREGVTGTIVPGAEADLLLLAANPLEDVSHVRFVRGVMIRGRWIGREELHGMREELASGFELEAELVRRVDGDSVAAALEWLDTQEERPRMLALDELGYQKLKLEDAPEAAVLLFRANARLYPEQWTTHASLAEGLLAVGERAAAERAARRAWELATDRAAARRELAAMGLEAVLAGS